MLDAVIRGLSLVLAGLFVLAAAHKASAVHTGSAATEPLIRISPWRRRHAPALLVAAGLAELAVAAAVVAVPVAGLAAAALLALVYARELRRLPADASCNCFGAVLSQTRASAIRRNLAVGTAILVGSAVAASEVLARLPRTLRGAQMGSE